MKISTKMIRIFYLFAFLFGAVVLLPAQMGEQFVIYLKDGSIFSGEIQEYDRDKELVLKVSEGQVFRFSSDQIDRIVQQGVVQKAQKAPKIYNFRENGVYFLMDMGLLVGNNLSGDFISGMSVHAKAGYRLSRLLELGAGTGVDFYNAGLGGIIPAYIEGRSYILKKRKTPFIELAAGVGFPVLGEDTFFTSSQAGYYLSPGAGLRLGGEEDANFMISFGMVWQRAKYFQDFGDGISGNEDTYTFRRARVRFGWVF